MISASRGDIRHRRDRQREDHRPGTRTRPVSGGETEGVIGSEARENLKRLPSDVYWSGLLALGIRTLAGSRTEVLAAGDAAGTWSPNLPEQPRDLLEATTFRLTPEEASFLRDRLALSAHDTRGRPGTLLGA